MPTASATLSLIIASTPDSSLCVLSHMQWCWHTLPAYDQGIFVKQATVAAMGLRVPPTGDERGGGRVQEEAHRFVGWRARSV